MKAQCQSSPPGYELKDFFFNDTATTEIYTLSLHDALPISKDLNIQRYKGLGEMNPSQLWDTTMDPTRRTLLQATIETAVVADYAFTTLMRLLVDPRKAFIEQHAKEVVHLDI